MRARFDFPTRRVSALDLAAARWLVAALLLPVALAACGGGGDPKQVPATAVALVGDEAISRVALNAMLAATQESYRLRSQSFPPAGSAPFVTARNKLLDQLVEEAELEQHAKSQFDVAIGDAQVEQRLDELRARTKTTSETQFEQALARQGLTKEQVKAQIRKQLLGEAVFARLSAKTSISEDEVERYYRSHREGYEQPASRRVRHILVSTRAQAGELERKLRDGGDFAALAKRYSIDNSTAASGGVLPGGIERGQTLPAFEQVAFALKTNAIAAPFQTKSGWEIVQATSDVKPPSATPLSEVRSTIAAALAATKRKSAVAEWARETRKDYAKRVVYAPGFGPAPQTPN